MDKTAPPGLRKVSVSKRKWGGGGVETGESSFGILCTSVSDGQTEKVIPIEVRKTLCPQVCHCDLCLMEAVRLLRQIPGLRRIASVESLPRYLLYEYLHAGAIHMSNIGPSPPLFDETRQRPWL